MKKIKKKLTMKGQVRKAYKEMVHLLDPRTITSDEHIPLSLIKHAKGLVFLTVVKAGVLLAGNFGTGVIIKKLDDDRWSNPASVGIGGFGVGVQVGVTSVETVLVLTSDEAVDTFCNNGQFKLGGNFSVAAGPVGRQGEAAFAPAIKPKVPGEIVNSKNPRVPTNPGRNPGKKFTVVSCYSYSHSSGLFVGISLEGTVLIQRPKDNKKYYGKDVTVREILSGEVEKEDYDRNLHLLHQSLALLAERMRDPRDYSKFDNYFSKSPVSKEFSEGDMDESMQELRESTVFRKRISQVLRDAEEEVPDLDEQAVRPKAPSFKLNFKPVQQPAQSPDLVKMEEYFTLRKKDTIIGDGRHKLKLIEYEWLVELKSLVLDSGFLFTYGMLNFEDHSNKLEKDYFFDDFEYLMFALVENGKHFKSLARMKKVMGYLCKKGYQFRYFDLMGKAPENAIEFEKLYFSIAVNVGPDDAGSPVIGIDLSRLRPETFMDGREGELIQLLIWMIRIVTPNIATFRAGVTVIIDMSHAHKNNIPRTRLREKLRKFFKLVATYFPSPLKRIGLVKAHNSRGLKAAISSVGKVMLPSVIRNKIQVLTEDKLRRFMPEESIPIAWGGTRVPFTEGSFRKFLRSQGRKYVKSVREIAKVQEDVERENLFKV